MNYQNAYERSISRPEIFWAEQAAEIDWFNYPTIILSKDEHSLFRWYEDGVLNTSYLCLDFHVNNGRGDQTALIYDSPVTNTIEKYSYKELRHLVEKFAGGLQKLGVGFGDTVVIYMPMIPQAAMAMLACARLGAIHSVVFGGFASHELAVRIDDIKPKVLITASYGIEIDNRISYRPLLYEALARSATQPEHVVVSLRDGDVEPLDEPFEIDFSQLMNESEPANYVPVPAWHPLYVLYTSGTTGNPKGIVRDNGGHAVAMKYSMKQIYGVEPGEVFWAASDVGWVVGHSYIVYGPLINGCTTILFEGKPIRTPDASTYWRVISTHKVAAMFTAPTAIRAIRKEDPNGMLTSRYDLSSLKRFFVAGERCDLSTFHWLEDNLKTPIIDHWWQTESGWPMIATTGQDDSPPSKGGSVGFPVCGYDIQVLSENGDAVGNGEEGYVAVKLPLPPGCLPSLWNAPGRFRENYLSTFEGYFLTGDGGYRDEDGYFYIMGRVDDVINVSGHRLSTAAMEELVSGHPAVAECAVVGVADEYRGQRPVGLVVLKDGAQIGEEELESELIEMIRESIGALAYFKNAAIVRQLPKTRSGKILRRSIRNIADGVTFTTPSTIDDPRSLEHIADRLRERGIGNAFDERSVALRN
jgi:acyl-coenzyme A synthetase/AMP-(fatty) acid ligase